jgi:hypothetical protein
MTGSQTTVQGLFRTFEDFEFCAAFTDRKNTPTFPAVMVKKLPFSCLKFGRKFVVILAGRVRQSLCPLYRPPNLYLLLWHAPQQTEKSGAKFKIVKCSKQTLQTDPAIYFKIGLDIRP